MRRVIVDCLISVDGYLADANGKIDWFTEEEEFNRSEGEAWSLEMLRRADTLLFGRVTFEGMAQFWPSAWARENMAEIAGHLNGSAKIVFSKTLKTTAWQNTTIVSAPVRSVVLELKQRAGGDLLVLGSSSVVSALAREGLVDEYRLRIVPVILGAGRPLFRDLPERRRLRLVGCQAFRTGVLAIHYEPKA